MSESTQLAMEIMILESGGVMNLNPSNNLLHQQPAWTDSYPTCTVSTGFFGSQWHEIHPQYWSKYQVWEWLQHLLDTNQLDASCIPFQEFDINGEHLCSMNLQEFTRAAGTAGQVLYSNLQHLKWNGSWVFWNRHSKAVNQIQILTGAINPEKDPLGLELAGAATILDDLIRLPALPSSHPPHRGQCSSDLFQSTHNVIVKTEQTEPSIMNTWKEENYLYDTNYGSTVDLLDSKTFCRAQISMTTAGHLPVESPDMKKEQDHPTKSHTKKHNPRGTHLWEFIRDILLNPDKNPGLIKWEDRSEGIFRFLKSEAVAQLWGKKKNNSSMTYEKLSRAMRYYYKREILERVDGRRLVYKFGKNALPKVHGLHEVLKKLALPSTPGVECMTHAEQITALCILGEVGLKELNTQNWTEQSKFQRTDAGSLMI
ncbi:ETS homologous factor [Galemys pyrenaicus]|uniref:ETS homologous factor n=2 Tax=Boreoeutheria TaxID=1437010 RepID=A0A8J5ZWM8_GALPY|nr:ETS homologous factor [Galemys pyrenaicus]